MIISRDDPKIAKLYGAQDRLLERLGPILHKYPQIRLSGGTVLSREWLHHRVSFDLDFFVPQDFPLTPLAQELLQTGFRQEKAFFAKDSYQQLFGRYALEDQNVEVSFIQDRFHHLFKPVQGNMLKNVSIEDCTSIYMRKTAIIIGLAENYGNGRSSARDLFDLHVLAKKSAPLVQFVSTAWGDAMLDNFYAGLANADPVEIASDRQLYAYPEWKEAESGEKALALVMKEAGMIILDIEDAWKIDSPESMHDNYNGNLD